MASCLRFVRRPLPLLLIALSVSASAHAARSFYVAPDGDDSHDCRFPDSPCATIQEAIGKADSGDAVLVVVGTYTSRADAVVLIDKDLVLSGGWDTAFMVQTGLSAIDGQGERPALIVAGVTASVVRFAVRNGAPGAVSSAGGVDNVGTLTLTQCAIEDNQGGGIWNDGDLTINASTISGNTNSSGAGGIDHALPSSRGLILNNTTVSGNWTNGEGGGLRVSDGFVSLNNSTVTANAAAFGGGGIANRTRARLELQNTIIAGNSAPLGPDCFLSGTAETVSLGYNLVGDSSGCSFSQAAGDLRSVSPGLAPLLDNGGPTRTHGLAADSPAVDTGNPGGCSDGRGAPLDADQRGVGRPQGDRCDRGAVERRGAVCDMRVEYVPPHGLLMWFQIFAPRPARWDVWLHTADGAQHLSWARVAPHESYAEGPTFVDGLSLHGTVGVLSTLTGRDGVVCSAWETVATQSRSWRRRLP